MNRKLFVVLAFLLPSVLLTSCGIPNYFGNEDDYVTFTGTRLEIDETSNYEDGFDSSEIEPKLMLLYTIYDSTDIYSGIFLSTVEDRCIWRPKQDRCALTGGHLGRGRRTAKTKM